jgi:lipopolysaccharide transport system permease protein
VKSMLLAAWRYRYFVFSSIKTELRSKFVRSKLGGLWMILNPLSQVVIFAFVLSAVQALCDRAILLEKGCMI